jgi:hypothetical protein
MFLMGITVSNDPYMVHFGPSTSLLTEESRTAADSRKWKTSNKKNGKLGQASLFVPDVAVKSSESSQENRRKISVRLFCCFGIICLCSHQAMVYYLPFTVYPRSSIVTDSPSFLNEAS